MKALGAFATACSALLLLGACVFGQPQSQQHVDVVGAPQAEAGAPHTPSVEAGRRIAEANCQRCHAIGATGESPHPPAPPFRTLSQRYPVSDLQEAFAEGVRVGHPDMPEFQLPPDQIDDLLAYLQSVQAQPAH